MTRLPELNICIASIDVRLKDESSCRGKGGYLSVNNFAVAKYAPIISRIGDVQDERCIHMS